MEMPRLSTPGVLHDSHASDAGGHRRIAVPFLYSTAGATRTLVGTRVSLACGAARQRTTCKRAVADLRVSRPRLQRALSQRLVRTARRRLCAVARRRP